MRRYIYLILLIGVVIISAYFIAVQLRRPCVVKIMPPATKSEEKLEEKIQIKELLPIPLPTQEEILPIPEKISYDVILGGKRLGSAEFRYQERKKIEGRLVDIRTFTTQLMHFQDLETIWSDPETDLPIKVERKIVLWPRKEYIVEDYNQQMFSLKITKQVGKRTTVMILQKDKFIHNAILLPTIARKNTSFQPGWSFVASLPTQDFTIRYEGIKQIKIPAGEFQAHYFVSVPERFEIWISTDERKIPLKIRGTDGLGYTLVMRSYQQEKGI
ncbi:MAG: DUF3108 domain-containing protein [Candidatus Omnitrophica bacterium]|nr:DUF3108 domain-containing protein [Candidatus Omnitrophota bacterium]